MMDIKAQRDFEAAIASETSVILDKDVVDYLKDVARDVAKEMISITPVDTGHAKANWQVGLGFKPTDEIQGFDQTPVGVTSTATFANIESSLKNLKHVVSVIWIVNNTDYISRVVEDGHSDQVAPGEFSLAMERLKSRWT